MKKIRIILGIIVISASLSGQNRAHEINAMLGRGVNLGNGFEAPRDVNWGLEIRSEYLEMIADKGFSHVRVPIRWNDYAGGFPYYTIEQWFIDTVKKVVDAALVKVQIPTMPIPTTKTTFSPPPRLPTALPLP